MEVVTLLDQPNSVLVLELAKVTDELSRMYSELAFHKSEEIRAKRDIWNQYSTESYSFRDRAAAVASTDNIIMSLQIEAQIKSLTEQKFFIRLLIDNASD